MMSFVPIAEFVLIALAERAVSVQNADFAIIALRLSAYAAKDVQTVRFFVWSAVKNAKTALTVSFAPNAANVLTVQVRTAFVRLAVYVPIAA